MRVVDIFTLQYCFWYRKILHILITLIRKIERGLYFK